MLFFISKWKHEIFSQSLTAQTTTIEIKGLTLDENFSHLCFHFLDVSSHYIWSLLGRTKEARRENLGMSLITSIPACSTSLKREQMCIVFYTAGIRSWRSYICTFPEHLQLTNKPKQFLLIEYQWIHFVSWRSWKIDFIVGSYNLSTI